MAKLLCLCGRSMSITTYELDHETDFAICKCECGIVVGIGGRKGEKGNVPAILSDPNGSEVFSV